MAQLTPPPAGAPPTGAPPAPVPSAALSPAGASLLLLEDALREPPAPAPVAWPPLLERLTPNVAAFPSYPWPLDTVYGTIVHATRSGLDVSLEEEWAHTLRYFAQAGSNFAHVLVGPQPGQWARIQRDDLRAWHGGSDNPACPDDPYGLNRNWRSIEVAEPRKGAGFTGWQYRATAFLVARWHARDRLPLVHLRSLDTARSARGIAGHEDTGQGRCYGKSDPGATYHGGTWDWDRFLQELRAIAGQGARG